MEESELHTFRPTLEEWNDLPRWNLKVQCDISTLALQVC